MHRMKSVVVSMFVPTGFGVSAKNVVPSEPRVKPTQEPWISRAFSRVACARSAPESTFIQENDVFSGVTPGEGDGGL